MSDVVDIVAKGSASALLGQITQAAKEAFEIKADIQKGKPLSNLLTE